MQSGKTYIISYQDDFRKKPLTFVSNSFFDCFDMFIAETGHTSVDMNILEKYGYFSEYDGNWEVTCEVNEDVSRSSF